MTRPAGSISIGEMAKMSQVSLKTLRLWQAKGLLEPAYVDSETGYRYYSLDQCPAVDDIVQLRSMGFSLEEIGGLLRCGGVAELRRALEAKMSYIEEQERRIAEARSSLEHYLHECDSCEGEVLCDQIFLERTPERRAFFFDIEAEDMERPGFDVLAQWERALRKVKDELAGRDLPRSLFRNVACLVSAEDLRRGALMASRAVVFVDESYTAAYAQADVVPASQRLVMYVRHSRTASGEVLEAPLIRRMLDYAAAKQLEVAGDYLGETVADTPLFGYEGRDAFFKPTIPVRRA